METKNGRAVLLTKGGNFVNIRDKGYSIGDKVNIYPNTGRLCAMAASLVVCAGIGSYFMPMGYVSVDINPSLMMTLNVYNRVIDVQTFNDDARVLLNKTNIRGRGAEESVEMLIKASEEIGYINDDNRDVILEVVPGMIRPDMDRIRHGNIEITKETADRETLRMAQDIGVSMAKVKAIEEYTEKNGGDIRSNAVKFNDKSAKEMRNIMRNNGHFIDKNMPDTMPKDYKDAPKPQTQGVSDIKPPHNTKTNVFPIIEQRSEKSVSDNKPPKNDYKTPENAHTQTGNKIPELPSIWNAEPVNNQIKTEEKPQSGNTVPNKVKEPAPEVQHVHKEQKPQDKIPTQGDGKFEFSKPVEPAQPDNPSVNRQPVKEEKPHDEALEQNKPNREDSGKTEKQPQEHETKPDNSINQGNTQPSVPKREELPSQNNSSTKEQHGKETPVQNNKENTVQDKPTQGETKGEAPKPSEPKHEEPSPQGEPPNNSGNLPSRENMGGHNEHREMP